MVKKYSGRNFSCEDIAIDIGTQLKQMYENRKIAVSVFEDNQKGFVVEI